MSGRSVPVVASSAGVRWFQVGVVASLLACFLVGMLRALEDAQEYSERTMVELVITNMRSGLQIAKADAIIAHRESEMLTWEGGDPTRFLLRKPEPYRENCGESETALPAGVWCFDSRRRELIYKPRSSNYLRMRDGGEKILRWKLAFASAARTDPFSLRVENVTPYDWRGE